MKSKALQFADVEAHQHNQAMNSQLNEYVKARYDGLQPDNVFKKDVDMARRITDITGTPYRGDE